MTRSTRYSAAPIGINFLIAGYSGTTGSASRR